MRARSVGLAFLVAIWYSGIAGTRQPLPAQVVARDSAGIRITENVRSGDLPDPVWQLGEAPILDLTQTGVGPEHEFYRVLSGIKLDNGRIVIGNNGSNQLKVYTGEGEFLLSIGREGEGPGEFKQLDWVSRYRGDSIFAYDYGLGRWSIFSGEGEFGRSARVTTPGGQRVEIAQPFSSGSVLGMRVMPPSNLIGRDLVGMIQDEVSLMRFSPEGDYENPVATLPGPELWLPPRPPDQTHFTYLPALFGYWPYLAVGDDLVFMGTDRGFEVAACSEEGDLRRLIRIPGPERQLTGDKVDEFLERVREELFPGLAVGLSQRPQPDSYPWFSKIMVDAEGNIWVSEYVQLSFDPQEWTVFDSDGSLVGDIEIPRRFMIFDIGSDYVLGRSLDDLDVEHIHLYALLKDENGSWRH